MLPYFMMFLIVLLPLFIRLKFDKRVKKLLLKTLFLILLIFIGLRYEVGGDWFSYLFYYDISVNNPLYIVLLQSDPGYMLINYFCAKLNLGLGGVDLISGMIFLYGLFYFINKLKLPYLAYFIAFPYMIMIVAMGYTRQSIALGILMIAYVFYENKYYLKAIITILIAALFHKTAIFGFMIFLANRQILFNPIYIGLSLIFAFFIFNLMESKFITMYDVYVGRNAQSGGALPRLILNLITGIIYLINYQKYRKFEKNNIFLLLSYVSLFNFLLIPLSSTVADRLSLYILPLQIYVYSLLPYLVKNKILKIIIYLSIISIFSLYFIVWIFFANHRFCWIPYQNYLFL